MKKLLFILIAALVFTSCGEKKEKTEEKETEKEQPVAESEEKNEDEKDENYWKKVKKYYEKAKETGEEIPANIKEWVQKDVSKIGTFEYTVLVIEKDVSMDERMKRLNELGKDRWEVYWVDRTNEGTVFYLKKIGKSYLKSSGNLIKLLPYMSSE